VKQIRIDTGSFQTTIKALTKCIVNVNYQNLTIHFGRGMRRKGRDCS